MDCSLSRSVLTASRGRVRARHGVNIISTTSYAQVLPIDCQFARPSRCLVGPQAVNDETHLATVSQFEETAPDAKVVVAIMGDLHLNKKEEDLFEQAKYQLGKILK